MMDDVKKLALRIIDHLSGFPCLSVFLCPDFDTTCKIAIVVSKQYHFPYISKNHTKVYSSVIDFLFSFSDSFVCSHLVFCGENDSFNISYWKVV